MSASAIQLALILSPPFSLLILEVILYAFNLSSFALSQGRLIA
jgi:hypothetical protein